MMRLNEIESHIVNVRELRDIVGAMRSLAGMRMQEALKALPGIRRYADLVAAGILDSMALAGAETPAGRDPDSPAHGSESGRLLILCMAEHGFAGGFNERLFEEAKSILGPYDTLFILGRHGIAMAAEHGQHVAWGSPMPTRPSGTPEIIQSLSEELYRRIGSGRAERVEILHARYRQGTTSDVVHRRLLPFDASSLEARKPRSPVLHNVAAGPLREQLVAEYVFGLLTEATVESVASENAARFAAMESAHSNVVKKLERLNRDARQARQTEITAELLDVVEGVEALRTG